MAEFKLDMSQLAKAVMLSPDAADKGAKVALKDIKNDWVRESRDVAPIDKRNLRDQIKGDVFNPGASGYIEIEANATQSSGGKRFNYAYYIHEGHMAEDGGKLRTTGTVEKFLDDPAEKRQSEWQQWLDEEVAAELKKAGW